MGYTASICAKVRECYISAGIRGGGTTVLEPGTRVLVPGYEGISAGVRGVLVPGYEGINAGV